MHLQNRYILLKVVFVKGGERNFRGGAFAPPEVYLDSTLLVHELYPLKDFIPRMSAFAGASQQKATTFTGIVFPL